MGPLMRSLGEAAVADAGAERVYLMGFGEQWSHFHFAVMSRTATVGKNCGGRACSRTLLNSRTTTRRFVSRRTSESGSRKSPGPLSLRHKDEFVLD